MLRGLVGCSGSVTQWYTDLKAGKGDQGNFFSPAWNGKGEKHISY